MAMKATDSLDEEIDRGEVGDEKVGIDINGLLDDLGGDEERSGGAVGGIFAEEGHPFVLVFLTFPLGEAGVDEAAVLVGDGFGEAAFDLAEGFLGKGDGVADDDDVCSGEDFLRDVIEEGWGV